MDHSDFISPYSLDICQIDENSLIKMFCGKTVFFDGVFKGNYSLAIVNRHLANALIDIGVDLTCHTSEQGWQVDPELDVATSVKLRMCETYPATGEQFDIHLRNTWPPATHNMVGRVNAYVSFAWEELEFPQHLVDRFNRDLDLVMVTSNFVKQAFVQSGVSIPIEVIGNGCDHVSDEAGLSPSLLPPHPRKRILHVSSCFPRKGIDVLLDAYSQTFRKEDPVELVIKTFPNPDNVLAAAMVERATRLAAAPPVTVLDTYCDNEQLLVLYRTAAMIVAPSRGEGFALPLVEAMRLSVPVVTTNYGGQLDFCGPDTAWLVGYHLAASQAHVAGSLSLWAEPSVDELGVQMRAVLDSPDEAQARCTRARRRLAAHFTWRDVARRVLAALQKSSATSAAPRRDWSIDLISSWQQQCGIATYSQHLYGTLPFSGRLAHIFARRILNDGLSDISDSISTELKCLSVSRIWGYDLAALQCLIRQVEHGRGNVLWIQHHPGHFSTRDMEMLTQGFAKYRHRLRVITMHSVKEAMRGGSLQWTRAFDLVFVHSAEDAELLAATGHHNPIVIPHGVLPESGNTPRPDPDHFTIGSFGFLMPHKNVDQLVLAFAQARAYEPRLRLKLLNCVLPNETSRTARATLENLIKHLSLSDSISARFDFVPEDKLRHELAGCNLLAFLYGPSTETATGAARIAMAANRPMLCSRSPVLRDMWPLSHVVRSTDVGCIAEALLSLAQSPELLTLRDVDRRRASQWYSYSRIAARHVAAIEQILEGKDDCRRVA
ncbi:glycosyltransferase family 4 protein [Mesorhizobium sp. NPDC059025]|uniref:glycosyltransferase family 4 protein n=1 Tax=unclassified Mesorhizobium TaxID=325217 RepID=UPI0036719F8E